MTGAEVLAAYHYQPNLERRNHLFKGPQEVAPVYLETAHRIEALLLCHFLAMLTEALIEREIRTSMSNQGLDGTDARWVVHPPLRRRARAGRCAGERVGHRDQQVGGVARSTSNDCGA